MKLDITKLCYLLIAAGGIVVTQSCVTKALNSKPIEFNSASQTGLIMGSITFNEVQPRFDGYYIYTQSLDNKKDVSEIFIDPETEGSVKHNGELNNGKTYLFALEKNPGRYEINKIKFTSTNAEASQKNAYHKDFSIPFEVKKGEITYIGELNIDEYGLDRASLLNIQDDFVRDMQGMRKKQPHVDWTRANKASFKMVSGK